jgi:cytochrome c-type biogenesis protein CcmH/NrfF
VRLVAVLLMVLITPATAAACPRTSLGDVSDEVMCLQCGVPLNVSAEAPAARRQRVFIQEQVDQCKSKQEIKDALVAQFGPAVLAEPQDESAWLVPALGFSTGALAIAFAVWRWRRRRTQATPAAVSQTDSARIDADLGRYDL